MKFKGDAIMHGLALLACCSAVEANLLPAFEPVIVGAGDIIEHVIELQEDYRDGARIEIRLLSRPEGARIVVNDEGLMTLTWKTAPDLDEQTELVIQARNIDTQAVIQTQELLVKAVLVVEENGAPAALSIEPVLQAGNSVQNPLAEPVGAPELQQPDDEGLSDRLEVGIVDRGNTDQDDELELLAPSPVPEPENPEPQPDVFVPTRAEVDLSTVNNQIISVGRTVSMRFNASSSDGEEPVLLIDRLPGNASFEKDINGGYILFWQTGNRDQGEYVFKVTAEHPLDNSISQSMYWTLVIGDPSIGRTVPDDFDQ